MSSLSQCPNGHFYDRDIYTSCPYCDNRSMKVEENNPTRPLFQPTSTIPTAPLNTAPQKDPTPSSSVGTVPPVKADEVMTTIVKHETKLVVGWLAAIEGPHKGESFELYFGYNRVGRAEGDIKLTKDSTISRADHFRIVYNDSDEEHMFLFFAGDSDNYPKVNGKTKYYGERVPLEPYALIEAGKSKFIFVPLCSESFKWPEPEMSRIAMS